MPGSYAILLFTASDLVLQLGIVFALAPSLHSFFFFFNFFFIHSWVIFPVALWAPTDLASSDLGSGVARLGHHPWPWTWDSSSPPLQRRRSLALSVATPDLGQGVALHGHASAWSVAAGALLQNASIEIPKVQHLECFWIYKPGRCSVTWLHGDRSSHPWDPVDLSLCISSSCYSFVSFNTYLL